MYRQSDEGQKNKFHLNHGRLTKQLGLQYSSWVEEVIPVIDRSIHGFFTMSY